MSAATSAFAVGVVAGIEQHSMSAFPAAGSPAMSSGRRWLNAFTTRAPGTSSVNTSLEEAPRKVDRAEACGASIGIVGVDHDAPRPIGQPGQGRRQLRPVDRDQDEARCPAASSRVPARNAGPSSLRPVPPASPGRDCWRWWPRARRGRAPGRRQKPMVPQPMMPMLILSPLHSPVSKDWPLRR